jgi:very-short-patch-repair endonuclease
VISKQEMKNRARDLRKESTIAELNLWYTLRNRGLKGYKFHRQFVMGSYIVDFVCWEKKLVIEIDGGQHVQNIKYDENRTAYLNERGFRVLSYWNDEVLNKTEYVLENILEALESIA